MACLRHHHLQRIAIEEDPRHVREGPPDEGQVQCVRRVELKEVAADLRAWLTDGRNHTAKPSDPGLFRDSWMAQIRAEGRFDGPSFRDG